MPRFAGHLSATSLSTLERAECLLLLLLVSQFLGHELRLEEYKLCSFGQLYTWGAFAWSCEVLVFERHLFSHGVDERDSTLGARNVDNFWWEIFRKIFNNTCTNIFRILKIQTTQTVSNHAGGTCTREEGANSVCGPKLNDQIVFKGRVRKLGRVPDSLWFVLFC